MGEIPTPVHASDSAVQRDAEGALLAVLSHELGVPLTPRRLSLPDGSYVDVDGVSRDPDVLVEAWAHQGQPKGAQTKKILMDAMKSSHAAAVLDEEWRTILLFSDEAAARPSWGRFGTPGRFGGSTWRSEWCPSRPISGTASSPRRSDSSAERWPADDDELHAHTVCSGRPSATRRCRAT